MSLRFYSYDERPELEDRRAPSLEIWPAFMLESEVSNRCWGLLYERFGAFQHFLYDDEADEVVAEVNSVPVRVDLDDLPDRGWEDVLERGTAAAEEPTAVTAIAVAIRPSRLGQGLSRTCLERMRDVAGEHGFHDLVAPVRPSWKPRYPLVPIDRYIGWTTVDGHPFDPWLRTHAKLGAAIVRPCHLAMRIEGTVNQWEEWAGMAFPESGDYVVPGALTLVSIDREADLGVYVEPNVWMRHRIRARASAQDAESAKQTRDDQGEAGGRQLPGPVAAYEGSATVPSSTTTRPSRSSDRTASQSSPPSS